MGVPKELTASVAMVPESAVFVTVPEVVPNKYPEAEPVAPVDIVPDICKRVAGLPVSIPTLPSFLAKRIVEGVEF